MSNMTDIAYEIRTDIGNRTEQQDYAFASKENGIVFAVLCDGMGGHKGGAIASKTAVEEFSKRMKKINTENIPGYLIETIEDINSIVYNLRDDRKHRLNAGTTMVSVLIKGNNLYWVSAGDSRLYIIRSGCIKQITKDHNLFLTLDQLYKDNKITDDEYYAKSQKGNALISYLGIPNIELLDANIQPFALLPGDQILLATDGLYKTLDEEKIMSCFSTDIKSFADKLLQNVMDSVAENKDNTTYILLKILER